MVFNQFFKKSIILISFINYFYATDIYGNAIPQHKVERCICGMFAGRNDLANFLARNVSQILSVGSNQNCVILGYIDVEKSDSPKSSKRVLFAKNKLVDLETNIMMSSGDPDTLYDFLTKSIRLVKAETYDAILWNHGTGGIEPSLRKSVNTSQMFYYNPATKLIELDRSLEFLEYITTIGNCAQQAQKGCCFDDSTGKYITNRKLAEVFDRVCKEELGGKKFGIIIVDACLMSMIDVLVPLARANDGKGVAEYFVGSQEVVLGPGYDYTRMLRPFLNKPLSNVDFATHIVGSYHDLYSKITRDYTQSAIKMEHVNALDDAINSLSKLLIEGLKKQRSRSLRHVIAHSKSREHCTHFEEKSYIDMRHFFNNMLHSVEKIELINPAETLNYRSKVRYALQTCCDLIKATVISNIAGENLKNASGISIYFPDNRIHASYPHTYFAQHNKWSEFLSLYLAS